MAEQLTTSAEALRLFFTDDIYLVRTEDVATAVEVPTAEPVPIVSVPSPVALVSADPVAAAPADVPETVFKYLGKNQKNVLILVNDAQNEVSSESGRELLRNLVKAMQLTANDFALVNYHNYNQVKFEELSNFFNSKLVLGFGLSPAQLGLNDQPLHSVGVHGEIKLVFTGRLDLLSGDQDGKKKLWSSLKQFTF